jgi:hypothetical protein
VNGKANAGLFRSTEQQARGQGVALSQRALAMVRRSTGGPVSLRDLQDAIQSFVRNGR